MDILSKIKFSEVVFKSKTENMINGKRIIHFNGGWLHLDFKEHPESSFSAVVEGDEFMYENEEYIVKMHFLVPNKIKDSLYVGNEFKGGYGGKQYLTGIILEVLED